MNNETILDGLKILSTPQEKITPPFFTFKHLGEFFVYDTYNCVFFHIDEPTKDFLDICIQMPFEDAKQAFLSSVKHSGEDKEGIIREVEIMAENGLFLAPNYNLSERSMEKQLKLRYESAWDKLELALSESCNLACKYCYCSTCRDTPEKGLMSEKVARAAVNWLFANSGKSEKVSITFFGGEPLLNKPVLKFVIEYSQKLAKLHGKGVFYSMTTNGTLLDDEIITYIKRYNFGLMVSLDGPKELHDKQCPTQSGQGSFDAAAKGIKKLMARRRSVTVRGTMIHPLPKMLDLIKFYEEFGFTRMVIGKSTNPVNASSVDCDACDLEEYFRQSSEEIVPWIVDKIQKGETPKYNPYSGIIEGLENGKISKKVSPFKCGAARGTTTVGADGTLYPCHRFTGMKEWQIGNIFDGPDYERCKNFWRNYHKTTVGRCSVCWQYSICKGPCPWELANANGTFREPYQCRHSEEYIKNAAYIYFRKNQSQKILTSEMA